MVFGNSTDPYFPDIMFFADAFCMFVCLSRVICLSSYHASVNQCIICKCMNSNISQALKNILLKILWVSRLMSSVFVSTSTSTSMIYAPSVTLDCYSAGVAT